MKIDARTISLENLFRQLKEILAENKACNVEIELLVNSTADAKKVKAFVSMSGCSAEINKEDDCYIMRITGTPCCA